MTKFLRWQNTPDLALLRRKRDKCNEKQFEEENQMAKIQMTTPLVEMDGDEMTRVLWQ